VHDNALKLYKTKGEAEKWSG